jgi:hypothetical protein
MGVGSPCQPGSRAASDATGIEPVKTDGPSARARPVYNAAACPTSRLRRSAGRSDDRPGGHHGLHGNARPQPRTTHEGRQARTCARLPARRAVQARPATQAARPGTADGAHRARREASRVAHAHEDRASARKSLQTVRAWSQIVGVTGIEPATSRPPAARSDQTELHPEVLGGWLDGTPPVVGLSRSPTYAGHRKRAGSLP